MDVEGNGFLCASRELFVSKSVWRFLFEGVELDHFCKGFDVECSCFAYDYGDSFDIYF